MISPLIARFMGPTWGPSGADRTQVGPMLAHEFLLYGTLHQTIVIVLHKRNKRNIHKCTLRDVKSKWRKALTWRHMTDSASQISATSMILQQLQTQYQHSVLLLLYERTNGFSSQRTIYMESVPMSLWHYNLMSNSGASVQVEIFITTNTVRSRYIAVFFFFFFF